MDYSNTKKINYNNSYGILSQNQNDIVYGLSKKMSQQIKQQKIKNVLIIYSSGAMAANKKLQIQRGQLHKLMSQNFYLCDLQYTKKNYPKLQTLVTPILQSQVRVQYKIKQVKSIQSSINVTIQKITQIAQIIKQQYKNYDSFLIISGLDTICQTGTVLSFMLQNLSKLVMLTGGYLPLSHMRSDCVSCLVQCLSLASQADSICDVLIVNKNKAYRANRCLKLRQGDFDNIGSPNMLALCSIKTKIRVRSFLFRAPPSQQFQIFTQFSPKYELRNPHIDGIVIQSYSFANIPQNQKILQLFKNISQTTGKIFINVSQAITRKSQSLMKKFLQQYNVYFGGDMTTQAAVSKLAYLIGKKYQKQQIIQKMQTNLRGQLTQSKQKMQFKIKQVGVMQIVNQALKQHFPIKLYNMFIDKLQNNIAKFVIPNCSVQQFKDIFQDSNYQNSENQQNLLRLITKNNLIHRAVQQQNINLVKFLLSIGVCVNLQDIYGCSPMFYALKTVNKTLVQILSKYDGRVIALINDIFQLFIYHIKNDNQKFFELILHIQFKNTLKNIKNSQNRTVLHLSGLFKAKKCYQIMQKKFKINANQLDIYGVSAKQYFQTL